MEANLALPAALIGDPVRAAILSALCDGRAQPAGALACAARVSPQCASNHLAKLTEGGLLAVETEGRHRYYRLATPHIAAAIEALACIAPAIRSLEKPRTSSGGFAPDSGSINSREIGAPPPYPPLTTRRVIMGSRGQPLHRLPPDLQRNGGNDARLLSRL
jgi:DNA-binding transcriptional ArsR family regulator